MIVTSLIAGLAVANASYQAAPTVTSLKTIQGVRPIALAAGPFGSRFAASLENATIRIYDVINLTVVKVLIGHPQPAYAVAWNPKGTMIASGDESARIFLWDVKTGKKIREMRTHIRGIQALSFDSTGTRLVSTGKDDVVKIYDVKTGKELRSIPGKGINFYSAQYLPGGSFGVGTLGDSVRVYTPNGALAKRYAAHDDKAVWDFDYSAKSNRLVTAGRDGKAAAFDLKTANRLQYLRGHEDWVVHTRLTPNGRFAFTSSTDRTVRIWNLKSLASAGKIENMSSVGSPLAVTANGQYLVGENIDGWMQVFEIKPPQAK